MYHQNSRLYKYISQIFVNNYNSNRKMRAHIVQHIILVPITWNVPFRRVLMCRLFCLHRSNVVCKTSQTNKQNIQTFHQTNIYMYDITIYAIYSLTMEIGFFSLVLLSSTSFSSVSANIVEAFHKYFTIVNTFEWNISIIEVKHSESVGRKTFHSVLSSYIHVRAVLPWEGKARRWHKCQQSTSCSRWCPERMRNDATAKRV